MNNELIEKIGDKMRSFQLPRWNELPDFGLYLDQVLNWLAQRLDGYDISSEKMLTSSMVNNYVKMGAIPAPERKKYYRPHLALLIVICVLKPVIAISDIRDYLSAELMVADGSALYDGFCRMYETTSASTIEETIAAAEACNEGDLLKETAVRAALRACAERSIAQAIIKNSLE